MTAVAILQSNYIPWKGYFDIANDVDLFVFYDDVQYTKRDWRNRNRIKAAGGSRWLSVPVGMCDDRMICEVSIPDPAWQRSHWDSLRQQYSGAPHFRRYRALLEDVYLARRWTNLSELNHYLVRTIAINLLGISTQFIDSREFAAEGRKLDRLLDLLVKCKATRYVSGPAAKDYIDPQRFDALGIELVWKDYAGYPEYAQLHPPFEHAVTVLDLLFHTGPDAPWHIWGWRNGRGS